MKITATIEGNTKTISPLSGSAEKQTSKPNDQPKRQQPPKKVVEVDSSDWSTDDEFESLLAGAESGTVEEERERSVIRGHRGPDPSDVTDSEVRHRRRVLRRGHVEALSEAQEAYRDVTTRDTAAGDDDVSAKVDVIPGDVTSRGVAQLDVTSFDPMQDVVAGAGSFCVSEPRRAQDILNRGNQT